MVLFLKNKKDVLKIIFNLKGHRGRFWCADGFNGGGWIQNEACFGRAYYMPLPSQYEIQQFLAT